MIFKECPNLIASAAEPYLVSLKQLPANCNHDCNYEEHEIP